MSTEEMRDTVQMLAVHEPTLARVLGALVDEVLNLRAAVEDAKAGHMPANRSTPSAEG